MSKRIDVDEVLECIDRIDDENVKKVLGVLGHTWRSTIYANKILLAYLILKKLHPESQFTIVTDPDTDRRDKIIASALKSYKSGIPIPDEYHVPQIFIIGDDITVGVGDLPPTHEEVTTADSFIKIANAQWSNRTWSMIVGEGYPPSWIAYGVSHNLDDDVSPLTELLESKKRRSMTMKYIEESDLEDKEFLGLLPDVTVYAILSIRSYRLYKVLPAIF